MNATFKGLFFLACIAVSFAPPPEVSAGNTEDEIRSLEELLQSGQASPEDGRRYTELVETLQSDENPTPTPLPRWVRKVHLNPSLRTEAAVAGRASVFSIQATPAQSNDTGTCTQFNNLHYDAVELPWNMPDSWTRDGEFGDVSVRACTVDDACASPGVLGIESQDAVLFYRLEPGLLVERHASATFRMRQIILERNPQPDTTLFGGGTVWIDDGLKTTAVGFVEDLAGNRLLFVPIRGQFDAETGELEITDVIFTPFDWDGWHDYRLVRDAEGMIELFVDGDPTPFFSFPYEALQMASLGAPVMMFGNFIDGEVDRVLSEFDYFNYSVGMPDTGGCTSDDGRLRILSIDNPRNFDPVYDTHQLKLLVDVRSVDGLSSNTQSHKFFLRVDRTIRDAAGQPVRYLRDEVQIGPLGKGKNQSDVRATAISTWDGSDLQGANVPEGSYGQDTKVSLIRADPKGAIKNIAAAALNPAPTAVLGSLAWGRQGVMTGHWTAVPIEILVCRDSFLQSFRDMYDDSDLDPSNNSAVFLQKLENAVLNAARIWNSQAGANVSFSYGGMTNRSECLEPEPFVAGKQLIVARDHAIRNGETQYNKKAWNVLGFDPAGNEILKCRMEVFRRRIRTATDPGSRWNWVLGFPTDYPNYEQLSLQSIIAHELGHCPGLDHCDIPCAAMVSGSTLSEYAQDLYTDDVYTLRFFPGHGYGTRTGQRIRHLISADMGVTWNEESSSTARFSNLRPGIATKGDSAQFVLAWSQPDTNSLDDIKATVGTGAVFETTGSTPFGNREMLFGPSIAFGNGMYMATAVSASNEKYVYVSTSGDGRSWSVKGPIRNPLGNYIRSFKAPILAFTKTGSGNYWVLTWLNAYLPGLQVRPADRLYRIYSMVSTDNGQTWGNLQRYGNELMAPLGYDIACDSGKNECVMAYPLADGTNRIRHHSCLALWGTFGCLGHGTTSLRTRDTPGLAVGGGFWYLGVSQQDGLGAKVGTSRKAGWEYYLPWASLSDWDKPAATGVSMAYSDYLKRVVLYYVEP